MENLLTSEEAVIAAAASEAVALARAAAKSAKDAAMMVSHKNLTQSNIKPTVLTYEAENSLSKRPQPTQLRETVQVGAGLSQIAQFGNESDVEEPTAEELQLLQEELSKSIAVRSSRQPERKARRARAAEKASATVVSVKSGSTSKKKRGSQEIDHSDPLRYLRQTTSSSRLLTANEEQELSEGIQVLL